MDSSFPDGGVTNRWRSGPAIATEAGVDVDLPKVLYIAGIGRSGSTLVNRTVGASDGCFAAGEIMHLFGRGMLRNELCSCGEPVRECPVWSAVLEDLRERGYLGKPLEVERFRRRITEGYQLPALFLPWKPEFLSRKVADFRELLGETYRSLRRVTGCEVVVDSSKNAGYGRLVAGIPDLPVYVLHLVRDSRGVAYSLEKRKRRPGTRGREEYLDRRSAASGSLFWTAAQLLAEQLQPRVEGYSRLRYRDFVRSPAPLVERALRLAGEYRSPIQIQHINGSVVRLESQHLLAGNPSRSQVGDVRLREDMEWRVEMNALKKATVTSLTLPYLLRYGYLSENGRRDSATSGLSEGADERGPP